MDNPIVMQLILAVLVLTALVTGALSVKTWRAWNVVGGFLVFIMAVTYLVLAAMHLKTRRVWLKEVDRLEKQQARLLDEQVKLTYGDLAAVSPTGDNLHSLRYRLHRLTLARGRVWRGCPPQMNADGTLTVTIPTAQPGAGHKIPQNFVLYAFREADSPEGWKIPVTYLGEFQVVGVTETTVQLRQSLLAPALLAAGNQVDFQGNFVNNATWALYEILPQDDHFIFTDPEQTPNLAAENEPIFGQVNAQEVQQIVQQVLQFSPYPVQDTALQAIVTRYVRDGGRAQPTDPPEEQFVKVEFLKPYQEKVDSETSQSVMSSRFYDAQGQAQVSFLQRGESGTVSMPQGAVAVLPKAQADQLVNDGTCRPIEPVYVRPLRDFQFLFHNYFDRWVDLRNQIGLTQYNKRKLEQSLAAIAQVIQAKQTERVQVTEDLDHVRQEKSFVTALADTLSQQLSALRSELSSLYRANLELVAELEQVEQAIRQSALEAARQAVAP
ncbi:MAG: hypothetical protein KatS3mg110_4697 [Pirellulaceae bacterium]|nr:MAG: hypothetical protein KatS3mg110_3697 [Pirellulaceae bacterium]GIW96656.1 MAG: hypothetical protein KatS3mg110_4697 [Pirellulaceae bacterium]